MAHVAVVGPERAEAGATRNGHGGLPRRTRNTPRKRALLEVLETAEKFLSAAELHDCLCAYLAPQGLRVGIATVYNQLRGMTDSGKLDTLYGEDGEARYWLPRRDTHHHYLVCRSCRRALEIESLPVEEWAASLGATVGFSDVTHNLEFFGLCDRCADHNPRKGPQGSPAGRSSPSHRPGQRSSARVAGDKSSGWI
jgi:Fur family transcriptional regulator, ferric uptake regulator